MGAPAHAATYSRLGEPVHGMWSVGVLSKLFDYVCTQLVGALS